LKKNSRINFGALSRHLFNGLHALEKAAGDMRDLQLMANLPGDLIEEDRAAPAFAAIRPGDMVAILVPFGLSRAGREWRVKHGRATICSQRTHGTVALDMGGRHGTPGVATVTNLVQVKKPGRQKPEIPALVYGKDF